MNPQLLRAALGNPQTFAEKSQTAMLSPINRYKTAIGRAATPEMAEAVRRQQAVNTTG
jgi:hypothetical protein